MSSFVFLNPVALFIFFFLGQAIAQTSVNGQLYTDGLSIVDAPAALSTYTAGGVMSIAIDVSGDGKLPMSAVTPGNNAATGYDNLNLYLVSVQTNLNISVTNNTDILTQESGSTVKHINWNVPSCITPGVYNLTVYEGSHINNQGYYTITPISLQINNPDQSGQCTGGINTLDSQPQPSSPSPQSPWIQNSTSTGSGTTTTNAASHDNNISMMGLLLMGAIVTSAIAY
ncbi:hypothetical protein FIBSPDRAFT_925905 [Athelia psychrophila]|uniref:Lytic polysaccharide monooxygenase n=1 Tax=Athelia psychrophila TaxID=1759441 RepID=A0A166U0P3_9AGAM|nr:hypothetical protein FIBSPDRAFT_925905 [Fibularhizoctonia sp. CBS 109695]